MLSSPQGKTAVLSLHKTTINKCFKKHSERSATTKREVLPILSDKKTNSTEASSCNLPKQNISIQRAKSIESHSEYVFPNRKDS